MKKVALVVLIIIASVSYWLISPFFIDKEVSESLPTNIESEVVRRGGFEGFDRIHTGSGDVSIIKTSTGYVVRFEDNFNVANGPDLYVGLGKDGEYKKGTELAKLKGNIGSQNYVVPSEINLDEYNEVWIWCRVFSVGFAKAILNEKF